jgi:hypothetical protein
MKVGTKESNEGGWKPKKFGHQYTDFKLLTVYCMQQGFDTPERVAYEIYEHDWMDKKSKHRTIQDITAHIKQAWEGAKKEVAAIGEGGNGKLNESEKSRIALDYASAIAVYDTLKNDYIEVDNFKSISPTDCYYRYNSVASPEQFIAKYHFENAFESNLLPRYSPINEWAKGLPKWNGKTDYIKRLAAAVPAKDPVQMELYLKSWLIRTYIQAVNPHNKNDAEIVNRHFLILQSVMEGSGKSTFLQWLCPVNTWRKVSGVEQGKDGKRALAEYMVIIDDEMAGLHQYKEHEALKSLISMPKVDVRLPYAKKDSDLRRVASFCGSCNDPRILSIGEQGTRFLCVALKDEMFDYKAYENIDKSALWGQVKAMANTKWLSENDAAVRAIRVASNESFERESIEKQLIEKHTRPLMPEDVETHSDKKTILRTGDVLTMLKAIPEYKHLNLNLNVLGSALTKVYGPPHAGYFALNIFDELGNIKANSKYMQSLKRSTGYSIYLSAKAIQNKSQVNDLPPKKAKQRSGYAEKPKNIKVKKRKK